MIEEEDYHGGMCYFEVGQLIVLKQRSRNHLYKRSENLKDKVVMGDTQYRHARNATILEITYIQPNHVRAVYGGLKLGIAKDMVDVERSHKLNKKKNYEIY